MWVTRRYCCITNNVETCLAENSQVLILIPAEQGLTPLPPTHHFILVANLNISHQSVTLRISTILEGGSVRRQNK